MAWKKRDGRSWRDFLTKEEAAEIKDLEKRAGEIDAERRSITSRRYRIVNRAVHRKTYAKSSK